MLFNLLLSFHDSLTFPGFNLYFYTCNLSNKSLLLVDPILFVQIWDNNKFGKDGYIGQLALDLLSFDGNDAFVDLTFLFTISIT